MLCTRLVFIKHQRLKKNLVPWKFPSTKSGLAAILQYQNVHYYYLSLKKETYYFDMKNKILNC